MTTRPKKQRRQKRAQRSAQRETDREKKMTSIATTASSSGLLSSSFTRNSDPLGKKKKKENRRDVRVHAKSKKKSNVDEDAKKKKNKMEPMPGDEEEEEDEEDDEFEYEEVEVDEDGNEIVVSSEEDEEEEEEARDASDLAPKKGKKSSREKKGVQQQVTKSIQKAYENEGIRNLSYVVGFFLAGTLGWSIYKVYRRSTSRRAVRKKTVNKNVLVIERLKPFFPNERESMTRNVAKGIARSTGFTTQEVFRKYLRYKMVEEPFTGAFVEDILALKKACELTPKQMSEILSESAARMVKKYGTLILDVSELTKSGAERKMVAAQMFSKLCYLADLPALVEDQEVAAETGQKLKELFGATDEDYARLRVDSLSESSDVSVLEKMSGFDKTSGGSGGGENSSAEESDNKDDSSEAGGV